MAYKDLHSGTRDFGALYSVDRFSAFIEKLPCRDGDQVYLADLCKRWLEAGDAVEASGGQFANYLRTCLYVADLAMKDPSELQYEPPEGDSQQRQLIGIVNPHDRDSALAFNREYYEAWAFHHVSGQTGLPPNETRPPIAG